MHRPASTLWYTALLGLLLGACGKSEPAAPEPAPISASADPVEGVTLEVAGAAPRAALRYTVASKTDARLTLAMTMRMTLTGADGVPKKVALPVVDLGLTVQTRGRDDAGLAYALAVDRVTVRDGDRPDIAARLATALKGLEGLTRAGVIDGQGLSPNIAEVTATSATLGSPDVQASVRGALGYLLVSYPAEAVGVGARWHRTQRVRRFGVPVLQRVSFTLRRVDDHGATVAFTVTQSAPAQPMPLSDGAVGQLTRLEGTGSGTVQLAFDQLAPRSLALTVATTIETLMGAATRGIPMKVTLEMTLKAETTP